MGLDARKIVEFAEERLVVEGRDIRGFFSSFYITAKGVPKVSYQPVNNNLCVFQSGILPYIQTLIDLKCYQSRDVKESFSLWN